MRLVVYATMPIAMALACTPAPTVARTQETVVAPGKIFADGARVQVRSRSGTFKPADTGHTTEVNVTAGKTGTVIQEHGESIRVRFDAQTWDEFPPTGATVDLPQFEATLHVSYLQAIR